MNSKFHLISTLFFSFLMILIGSSLLIVTLIKGGSVFAIGFLFGFLFIAAGLARIFLLKRKSVGK